ncbi:TlyA family RNA methyltransferase [Bacteroidales bacterium OttesenSCG-928-B11]|nr:TlyA family RNA methyltransferase [Bacteroidales bacterium OttesenSCG-928-B11]MDL2326584.1 TlyA family RNA methyltransferase [Bacteroidales bacterium OttesenSCG-928-A14]
MERIDRLLFIKGIFPSREKAQDAINHRTVKVNGSVVDKPSKMVDENVEIEVVDIFNRYVSRGGLKLEKAIADFGLEFAGKNVLDIGASTGGFTDCALKHGATFCYCIDVGTNQLHNDLRNDPRVVFIEQKDFRDLKTQDVDNKQFDFIVADLSFISLTYLFPYLKPFLKESGELILLIKPQFEAGASFLNKSGIVIDDKAYKIAIQKVATEALNHNFYLQNLTLSTLFEITKNVEFLSRFSSQNNQFKVDFQQISEDIRDVKKKLKKK